MSPVLRARTMIERPAAREVVPLNAGESFRWIEHDYPSGIARWNYHPEIEIHLIRRSTGSYIIGDQVGAFGPGHVAIVGAGVPHDWMSDVAHGESIENRDAVIQFTADWVDRCIQLIPELDDLRTLVHDSQRGLVFSGSTAIEAAWQIELVGVTAGSERISHLLALFGILLRAPDAHRHFVTNEWYSSDVGHVGKAAVDAGLAYVLANLTGHIRMAEAAKLAYMSEPSFSKFFKKATGITFSDMVKRLRIASACRLLDQTDSSIATISTAVGYRNLANFNRQFLAETGMTPTAYRSLDEEEKPPARRISLGLHAER